MVDTSRTLVIESSPGELLLLVMAGVLMAGVSLAVVLLPDTPGFYMIVAYFGTAFFGLATIVQLWRLFRSPQPVLTISPQGIRDTRVAAAPIPWSEITRIWTWQYRFQKFMVLAIKPSIKDRCASHLLRGGLGGLTVRSVSMASALRRLG